MKRQNVKIVLSMLIVVLLCSAGRVSAASFSSLTAGQKNSTYGFFVWLSENANTADEKEDARIAAELLTNSLTESHKTKVRNSGTIIGGSNTVTYQNLLDSTRLGAEDDATSLSCMRESINFVSLGNTYRAKENLDPLTISSAMMAMSELDANYQDNRTLDHPSQFNALENLAYRMVGGTWIYGNVGGGVSDDPYEGWYTKEKANFDSNNGGETGHYKTMTDRQGKMLMTGFGVRHRYVNQSIVASDGNPYDCRMHDKYYSQHYSTRSDMYDVGTGVTPTVYLTYLNTYECLVKGHTWDNGTITKKATCTEPGSKDCKCSVCGKTKTETIAALGHDWNAQYTVDIKATCTETGKRSHHCSRCDAKKDSEEIALAEHNWGAWKVTKEATFTESGERTRSCTVCKKTETETIAVLGKETANAVVKGRTYTVSALKYKVTNADLNGKGTVTLTGTTAKKTKLKKLTVPAAVKINGASFKVTAIGNKAFQKCTVLSKVTIGGSVAKIGKSAFQGCGKLKAITFQTTRLTAAKVGSKAFKGTAVKAVVKVPKKVKNAYKKWLAKKGISKKAKIK